MNSEQIAYKAMNNVQQNDRFVPLQTLVKVNLILKASATWFNISLLGVYYIGLNAHMYGNFSLNAHTVCTNFGLNAPSLDILRSFLLLTLSGDAVTVFLEL